MSDVYLERMAKVMTHYSLDIKEGQDILVTGGVEGSPLMLEVYKEVLRLGAIPTMLPSLYYDQEIFFKYANDEQLTKVNPMIKFVYENYDGMIQIISQRNTKNMTNVDPKKMAKRNASYRDVIRTVSEREAKGEYQWVLTEYPTDAIAQEASMSLLDFKEFMFKACLVDREDPVSEWKAISKKQDRICEWLDRREEFRYVGLDTDLAFSIKGRKWINCDGKKNFPDGEVFTCPVEESVNGKIRFTYPLIYQGNEIEDVKLSFKDGEVESYSAAKGEALLKEIIATDEGSNKVGEIAIGTNYGIERFTKNILFDEKIGGTVHLALGLSAEPSIGKNVSSIHLDIIKEMRDGGKIYADDELFYENGKFLI